MTADRAQLSTLMGAFTTAVGGVVLAVAAGIAFVVFELVTHGARRGGSVEAFGIVGASLTGVLVVLGAFVVGVVLLGALYMVAGVRQLRHQRVTRLAFAAGVTSLALAAVVVAVACAGLLDPTGASLAARLTSLGWGMLDGALFSLFAAHGLIALGQHADRSKRHSKIAIAATGVLVFGLSLAIGWPSLDVAGPRTIGSQGLEIEEIALSRDGKRLAVARQGGVIALFDTASGKRLWAEDFDRRPVEEHGLAFSPRGDLLLVVAGHDYLVLDAGTGQLIHAIRGDNEAESGAFSAEGDVLVTAGRDDHLISFWSTKTWKLAGSHEPVDESCSGLISGNRGHLVWSICDHTPTAWDVRNRRRARSIHGGAHRAVRPSADGSRLATIQDGEPRTLRIVDADSLDELKRVPLANGDVILGSLGTDWLARTLLGEARLILADNGAVEPLCSGVAAASGEVVVTAGEVSCHHPGEYMRTWRAGDIPR